MQRTRLSVCCQSAHTGAKCLGVNAIRSRGSFAQSFSSGVMSPEDLLCNSVENLLNLNIYLFWVVFSFLPLWDSSLFDFFRDCCVWFLTKAPLADLPSAHCGTHILESCTLGRMLGTWEKEFLSWEKRWKTPLLFLCHPEGLLRKLPCRAYCSVL